MENFSRDGNMDNMSPPIVIMKPLHLSKWERAEVQKNLLFSANKEIEHADILRKEKVPDNGRMLDKALTIEKNRRVLRRLRWTSQVYHKNSKRKRLSRLGKKPMRATKHG